MRRREPLVNLSTPEGMPIEYVNETQMQMLLRRHNREVTGVQSVSKHESGIVAKSFVGMDE